MAEPLGQHLLIDLYACYEDVVNSPLILQEGISEAMEEAGQEIDELTCQTWDDETVVIGIASRSHISVHAYPSLGYIAVDIYSFENSVQANLIMKVLKKAYGAERVKATSVRRADFGSERDMKPRYHSSLSAFARVTRTRTRIKNTGNKLKTTGAKVFRVIRGKHK